MARLCACVVLPLLVGLASGVKLGDTRLTAELHHVENTRAQTTLTALSELKMADYLRDGYKVSSNSELVVFLAKLLNSEAACDTMRSTYEGFDAKLLAVSADAAPTVQVAQTQAENIEVVRSYLRNIKNATVQTMITVGNITDRLRENLVDQKPTVTTLENIGKLTITVLDPFTQVDNATAAPNEMFCNELTKVVDTYKQNENVYTNMSRDVSQFSSRLTDVVGGIALASNADRAYESLKSMLNFYLDLYRTVDARTYAAIQTLEGMIKTKLVC